MSPEQRCPCNRGVTKERFIVCLFFSYIPLLQSAYLLKIQAGDNHHECRSISWHHQLSEKNWSKEALPQQHRRSSPTICNFKKVTAFYELCFGFYIREQSRYPKMTNWRPKKNQEQYASCLLFLAKKHAFLSLGIRIKQWHANSVYQPVAGVQIVGTAQKKMWAGKTARGWRLSFLFFPLALWRHAAIHYLNACGTFYGHFLQ